jgi:glycerol-3-phosphate dehydrogenase (NAD(P)+)
VNATAIVGTGAWGSALGATIGVKPTANPAEAAAARLVILAVPSPRAEETIRALADVLGTQHIVLHAIGAILDGERVSDRIRRETSVKRIGAIAGPALARDLVEKRPSAVVVASPFDEVIAAGRAALGAPPVLRVYGSHDLPGVELASALVGAMTVGIGLADGIGTGHGPRAVLLTRAVAEAARLGLAAGAKERTFMGLAGLGNLLVRSSASSERSEDYQLGVALGKGEPRKETAGTRAILSAVKLARRLHVRTPILDALDGILHQQRAISDVAQQLLETVADEE